MLTRARWWRRWSSGSASAEPRACTHCSEAPSSVPTRPDEARVVGRTLFLRTPDGLGRSELAAQLARTGADTTARNWALSLIHISEPTRLLSISYAVFCLKKKKKQKNKKKR